MSIILPDPLLVLVVVVIFILTMRALLSWWLRTNEIVRELRTLNQHMERMQQTQDAIHTGLAFMSKQLPPKP